MKKSAKILFITLLVVCALSGQALAQKNLTIVNNVYYPVSLAVAYKDINAGWLVEGWWDIPANGQRTLRLNTYHRNIYIYAQNIQNNGFWHGSANNNNDRTFTVVDQAFKYIMGSMPYGKHKQVRFIHLNTKHYRNYSHTLNH